MNDIEQLKQDVHWSALARQYLSIPGPLRLVAEDVEMYSKPVNAWLSQHSKPRVLILGVTPEFYKMPWPEGTDILAVDRSERMLNEIWPGTESQTMCADWVNMALKEGSRDIAFCDGGLTLLKYSQQLVQLAKVLRTTLSKHGLFAVRIFEHGQVFESPASVMEEFLNGQIANSSLLKFRLALAMNDTVKSGVNLGAIWRYYSACIPGPEKLAALTGWTDTELKTIDTYKESKEQYYFPSIDDLCDIFCGPNAGFECDSVQTPTYPFSEHTKVVTFKRI